jgi:hypothetical protein
MFKHPFGRAILLICALFSAGLRAQIVRMANHSGVPFSGWKRTTIDRMPEHRSGELDGLSFVVGRDIGGAHVVDLKVALPAGGETRSYNLAKATPVKWRPPQLPSDPLSWFGGPAQLNGVPMSFVAIEEDGACISATLQARVHQSMHVQLFVDWNPSQPWLCSGEALVTCSNPAVPLLSETVPEIRLSFGDAIVLPLAGKAGLLVEGGTTFADGQARVVPLTFVWLRHLRNPQDWATAGAVASAASADGTSSALTSGIGAVGIEKLLPDGNPILPAGFSATHWAANLVAPSMSRIHTWDGMAVGVNKASTDTGAQEDQLFRRGESLAEGGVGAEWIAYLNALKFANRPCHHLEVDGSLVSAARHPNLVIWMGRPHWHKGVSPDRLGKPDGFSAALASGWYGSDVEHKLFGSLWCGARLTGSRALQVLLRHQCNLYMMESTTKPGMSTSQPYASRAVGYEGIFATMTDLYLEDRPMAAAVRAHWKVRWNTIIKPFYETQRLSFPTGWFMDVRRDDPRLGSGWWWIPWQQGVGAYGLDLAGRWLDEPDACAMGLQFARQVLDDGWVRSGDVWWSRATKSVYDQTPAIGGSFNYFGMSLGPAVVLRYEPQNEKARAICQSLLAGAASLTDSGWLDPSLAGRLIGWPEDVRR